MPSRPSKKAKVHPGAKPGGAPPDAKTDAAAQQRRRDENTKAVLGKYQGRKSI